MSIHADLYNENRQVAVKPPSNAKEMQEYGFELQKQGLTDAAEYWFSEARFWWE